jgi:hypothetical protein
MRLCGGTYDSEEIAASVFRAGFLHWIETENSQVPKKFSHQMGREI